MRIIKPFGNKNSLMAGAAIILGGGNLALAASTPGSDTPQPSVPAGTVYPNPIANYLNAQYATGGVSLRNKRVGAINISGVTGPVKKALLYWAYLYPTSGSGSAPASKQFIGNFCRWSTGSTGGVNIACFGSLQGTLIATGADPCWGSGGIAVYGVDVTDKVSGNGVYQINLTTTQSASFNNADPWAGSVTFPAAEGASLVIIGTGTKTVAVYDKGIAGKTFNSQLSYTLSLPSTYSGGDFLWDNIGADGQIGAGRSTGLGGETVTINGTQISGPSSSYNNSDWDGSSSWPLSQLWDDTGHNISGAVTAPASSISVVHNSPNGDCLSPIANVLSY
jgi:hypothetical protein